MDKKILFNEALTSLVDFSAKNGNELTTEDVKIHFKDLIDDDSQYQFIYDYLAVNNIKVSDAKTSDNNIFSSLNNDDTQNTQLSDENSNNFTESEEELSFINMYMEDLNNIPPAKEGEVHQLLAELADGNTDAVNRLIECHLSTVAEIAKSYRGKGVSFGDLIQEGNIGLMLALSDYTDDCGDFLQFITKRIRQSMTEIINEQVNSDRVGKRLADKLNQLDKVTKTLSEDLGRVPEISEIAKAMSITDEEVSFLLKTSLDTLSVNEDTQITQESETLEDTMIPQNALQQNSTEKDPLEWRVNKKKQ